MPCAQITFCSGVFEISQYLSIDSDHHAAARGCVLCSVFSPQASKTPRLWLKHQLLPVQSVGIGIPSRNGRRG